MKETISSNTRIEFAYMVNRLPVVYISIVDFLELDMSQIILGFADHKRIQLRSRD